MSVRTVAKWLTRASSLADRSSRPRRQPRRTSVTAEAAIVAVRRTRATAWEISRALGVPRCPRSRGCCTASASIGGRRSSRPRRCSGTSGRTWATCFTSTSNASGAWWAWGIESTAIGGGGPAGPGGSIFHVAIDDATRLTYAEVLRADDAPSVCGVPATDLRLVSSPWRDGPAPPHRQRVGLSGAPRARAVPPVERPPAVHPTLSAADQRQGRAVHPDPASRVGVPDALSQLGAPDCRPAPLSPLLQPPASSREPRPTLALDAFPRDCLR